MRRGNGNRVTHWLGIMGMLAAIALPALTLGDTIKLKDGSSLRGKVVTVTADSLTIETNFGTRIRIPRSEIITIVLDDSLAAKMVTPAAPPAATPVVPAPGDSGRVAVTFRDRKLSSKISIYKKKDWDGHLRANWIVQELVVDGSVVNTYIDSTMDKTIYKGQTREIKNDVQLPDIDVAVPTGMHQVVLVVRNHGAIDYADKFNDEPLNMEIHFDNLIVPANETMRLHVGISRGKLRMSKPKFYHIQ